MTPVAPCPSAVGPAALGPSPLDPATLQQFSPEQQAELAELLDRYLAGWEAGEPPSISAWVQGRPEMELALRNYIAQLNDLQNALHPLAVDPGASSSQIELLPFCGGDRRRPISDRRAVDTPPSPGSHGPQTRLGDYHLLGEIGRGGMGIVYRARQLSLGRDVAIKTLPFAAVLDPKQIKRFQNEAQAAAQLHHPNIVPVYAVGCERGVHYYSMQLIEGLSLDQVVADLRAGGKGNAICHQTTLIQPGEAFALPPTPAAPDVDTRKGLPSSTLASIRSRSHIESIVRLGIQAAEALHYAHQCGVIHRDIKPSNLMIDGRANLWITDFGLARCQQSSPMSVTGDLMGTLRYMSPEQASGRVHAVDHRTDIYSLGVTLYELLTLQLAFDAPNRIELITLINQSTPVAPRKLNPAIPADLETILCKAISREPLERYESAGEMAEDLQRFLRGEQPLAKRPTYLDQTLKWVTRHKHLFLATSLSLLVILCGLTVATVLIASHKRLATEASERADLHLMQTNRVVQNFGSLAIDRLRGIRGGETLRAELLAELTRYYLDFIDYAQGQPELNLQLGEAYAQLAEVYVQSGQREAASASYTEAIATLRELPECWPDSPQFTALAASRLAQAYGGLAALQAEEHSITPTATAPWHDTLQQAINLQRHAACVTPGEDAYAVELAALIIQQGDLLIRAQLPEQGLQTLQQAVEILDAQLLHPNVNLRVLELDTLCHNNLASLHQQSDPLTADRLLTRAIRSAEKWVEAQPAAEHSRMHLGRVLANAGALAMQIDQPERAEECLERAIQQWSHLADRVPPSHHYHAELAANQNSFGQFLLTQQRWSEAETQFIAAITTLEATAAAGQETSSGSSAVLSDLASVQNNLGLCYEKLQRIDDATVWYSRSLECQNQALSRDPDNPTILERLALHQRNLDRLRSGRGVSARSAEQ